MGAAVGASVGGGSVGAGVGVGRGVLLGCGRGVLVGGATVGSSVGRSVGPGSVAVGLPPLSSPGRGTSVGVLRVLIGLAVGVSVAVGLGEGVGVGVTGSSGQWPGPISPLLYCASTAARSSAFWPSEVEISTPSGWAFSQSPALIRAASAALESVPFNVLSNAAKNCCNRKVLSSNASLDRMATASAWVKDESPMTMFWMTQRSGKVCQ